MGVVIMLGTLFGLIVVVFGVALHYGPEHVVLRGKNSTDERRVDAPAEGGHWLRLRQGITFVVTGVYLSHRRRRLHPLLLLCISTISFSWIEAPYDWAVYAQSHPLSPACRPGDR